VRQRAIIVAAKLNSKGVSETLRGLLTDVIRLQEIKLYGLRDYLMSRWHTHFSTSRGDQLKIEQRAQRLRAIAGAINVVVGFGSQLWLLTRVFARGSA
jgi:hypothetical protein